MPTYEYHCQKCGHAFERMQSIKEPPLKVCPREVCPGPKWGKGRVQRGVGGGAGLLFKGSGFYITDYRSESYKQAASKDKPATDGGKSGAAVPAKPVAAPASSGAGNGKAAAAG